MVSFKIVCMFVVMLMYVCINVASRIDWHRAISLATQVEL